jgi:hypothetical protein
LWGVPTLKLIEVQDMKVKTQDPTVNQTPDGRTSIFFPDRFRLDLTPRQFEGLGRKVRVSSGSLTPWDRKEDRRFGIRLGVATLFLTVAEVERFAELLSSV